MKKLLGITYTTAAFNIALLLMRVVSGVLVVSYGYKKLVGFQDIRPKFMSVLGIGQGASLSLVIFAEFFCGILIVLGLLTRLAAIPLVISMAVAVFVAHHGDFFGDGQKSTLFLMAFATILLVGPGKISADGLINK